MTRHPTPPIRNLAVVAHVDHGKTTLVDALLAHARLHGGQGSRPRLDPDRDKVVQRMPKYVSLRWRDHLVNLVDTPAQSDPGGGARRVTRIVEGFLLVVDAREGPAPQSRHMLQRALEAGLVPLVAINKIDVPGARPGEALAEVREQFRDLEARPAQLEFAAVFVNARAGLCRLDPGEPDGSLSILLDKIVETVPAPTSDPSSPARALVADIDYDDFLGRLAIARVFGGSLERGAEIVRIEGKGEPVPARIPALYAADGLGRTEVGAAGAGEIVQVAGLDAARIGETLADPSSPEALPPIPAQEPVVSVLVSPNDSPLATGLARGAPGERLRERLWRELLTNPAIRVEETDASAVFRVRGRSELQIAILIEIMRREGFELGVSGLRIELREQGGKKLEPMELLTIDCPATYAGVIAQKAAARHGRPTREVDHAQGRVRLEFRMPARGLFGFRSELLNDTRGTGMMNHEFDGWDVWAGPIPGRVSGSLVADRSGRATVWAIEHLQQRGAIFVAPGDEVYAGMIVGEHAGPRDLLADVTKEERAGAAAGERRGAAPLMPTHAMGLERALEFVRDDEMVEVVPATLRLRKATLPTETGPS